MLAIDTVLAALDRVGHFMRTGGPAPDQYEECLNLFSIIRPYRDEYSDQIKVFHDLHKAVQKNPDSMQGHAVLKPHGYSGDFEIIDRIYRIHKSSDPLSRNWDNFFHWGTAARAVRGRRRFAVDLFTLEAEMNDRPARILNVASGPCTDVKDALALTAPGMLHFTCVDNDLKAIGHARAKLSDDPPVTFVHSNAFRLRPGKSFDLVWSAGLFDYLDDRLFVTLLKRLSRSVTAGGTLVVGNFGPANSQRSYMEFGFWDLNHRDEEHLLRLAAAAGFPAERTSIAAEETGVNLFLTIRF